MVVMEWTLVDPWRCTNCHLLDPRFDICPDSRNGHSFKVSVPLVLRSGPLSNLVFPPHWKTSRK